MPMNIRSQPGIFHRVIHRFRNQLSVHAAKSLGLEAEQFLTAQDLTGAVYQGWAHMTPGVLAAFVFEFAQQWKALMKLGDRKPLFTFCLMFVSYGALCRDIQEDIKTKALERVCASYP